MFMKFAIEDIHGKTAAWHSNFLNQILKLEIKSQIDCAIKSCEDYVFICIEYIFSFSKVQYQ